MPNSPSSARRCTRTRASRATSACRRSSRMRGGRSAATCRWRRQAPPPAAVVGPARDLTAARTAPAGYWSRRPGTDLMAGDMAAPEVALAPAGSLTPLGAHRRGPYRSGDIEGAVDATLKSIRERLAHDLHVLRCRVLYGRISRPRIHLGVGPKPVP